MRRRRSHAGPSSAPAIRRSYKSKLALSVTLLLLSLTVAFGWTFGLAMTRRLESRWLAQASVLARNLALGSELGVSAEAAVYLDGPVRGAMEFEDTRYVIITDATGRCLYAAGDTAGVPALDTLPAPIPEGSTSQSAVRMVPMAGSDYEAVAAVISGAPSDHDGESVLIETASAEGRPIGWVRVGVSPISVRRETMILVRRLALIGGVLLALGLGASMLLARQVTRPLGRLALAAAAIGRGEWDPPLDIAGDDEVGYLAAHFRRMSRHLRESQEEIREQNRTLEVKIAERTASLSRALEELRELDRMKDAFLSSVSHELRTPLTAIRSFSESMLLYEDEPRETRREFLGVIHRESERLSRLIEEVLDLSKIQSGRRTWFIEPFAIEEAIASTAETVGPLLRERGLRLVTPPAESRTMVRASRDGIAQVLQNLVGNAIKFSPEGAAIEVAVTGADGRVIVDVADRGPGIPETELEKVFDRFHQVGDVLTGKPKGTGLGLAICREVVRQHQGDIWAELRDGGGSRFRFSVPAEDVIPDEAEDDAGASQADARRPEGACPAGAPAFEGLRPPSERDGGPRLLVVDDDPNVRRHLDHELTRRGYRVTLASAGLEAIQLTRSAKPDLILLDIMMPDLMGFDVIRVLKNDPETASVPIVIVSVVEDAVQGLRMGASDYIAKPVAPQALVERIESLLHLRRPRVLLASSDRECSKAIRNLLDERRLRFEGVGDTDTAVRLMNEGDVDLIVLDGEDPLIDPAAFLASARSTPATEATPVLLLTGQSVGSRGVCALGRSADGVISRGADADSINAVVTELLGQTGPSRRAA